MSITKRIIIALVIAVFAVSQVTFASTETLPVIYTGQILANENPDKPDVYIDSDFVLRISANLEGGLKGQSLAAVCFRTENEGTDSEKTVAVYTSQVVSPSSDCKVTFASFEFPADFASGKYTVVISGQGITKEKSKSVDLYFYGASAVKDALSEVVAADSEDIYDAFASIPYGDGTTNADILKADYAKITGLSKDAKTVFLKMLDAGDSYFSQIDSLEVSENADGIMAIGSEFIKLYEGALCIASYYDANSASSANKWFELNQNDNNPTYDFDGDKTSDNKYLKQSGALNDYLKKLEDTDKEDSGKRVDALYTALSQDKPEFVESSLGTWDSTLNEMIGKITDDLRYEIILTTVRYMPTGVFKSMLEDETISEIFASDVISGYADLGDKKADFLSGICGKEYDSFEQFTKDCKELIGTLSKGLDTDDSDEKDTKPRVPSGGGGGSFAVSGTPEKESDIAKNGFTDLGGALWAQEAIQALYEMGVVNGKAEGIFDPTAGVTRSEFVKMIVVAFGFKTGNCECEFTDLTSEMWQYPYIATAYEFGIVNGYEDGSFGISNTITRQDMAVIMERALRAYGKTLTAGKSEFTDSALVAEYAKDAVSALSSAGIITGMPDGSFAPLDNVTRAQAAVVIYRAIK